MFPPQSQLSLPMPSKATLYGAGCPLAARSFASVVGWAAVMYSSHSAASCGVPEPTLTEMYASAPIGSRKSMNSCVPNVFASVTPPQLGLRVTDRCGPMLLRQWYSSAKQPPGQRTFGTFMVFKAPTTSLRIPRVFGILESGPTQIPSYTPWPRCSANCPKMLRSIFAPVLETSTDNSTFCATIIGAVITKERRVKPTRSERTRSEALLGGHMDFREEGRMNEEDCVKNTLLGGRACSWGFECWTWDCDL